jgi:ADP-Ribosyltransferase in polyvalent proteins
MDEERERIIEKALKIRELANRGIGGEKETAIRMLESYKEKHSITDEDMNVFKSIVSDWFNDMEEGEHGVGFVNWFKRSVAIDSKTNKPMVFYHKSRTTEPFDEFKHDVGVKLHGDGSCYGFHFVHEDDKRSVQHIGNDFLGNGTEFFVYLNMINPYYLYARLDGLSYGQEGEQYLPIQIYKDLVNGFIEKGFDSIIIQSERGANVYVVFNPNQIKSVKNNGDYNPENDNIYG